MASNFSCPRARGARWRQYTFNFHLIPRLWLGVFGFQWINTFFHSSEAILCGSLHPVKGLQNCIWKLLLISFYYAEGAIDVRQFARKTRLIGCFQLLLDFFKSTQDLTEFRGIQRSVHCHLSLTEPAELNQSDGEVETFSKKIEEAFPLKAC